MFFWGLRDRLKWRKPRTLWAGWKPKEETDIEKYKDTTLEKVALEIWKAFIDFGHCGYEKKRYTEGLCVHVGNGSEGVEMSSGRIEQTVEVGSAEARRERILKTGMMLKSRRSRRTP